MAEPQQPQGIPYLGVALAGPKPGALADLWSTLEDLSFVVRGCDAITALPQDASDGSTEERHQRVLWEAVVMAYGRCLTTGKGYLQPGAQRTKFPPITWSRSMPTSSAFTRRS